MTREEARKIINNHRFEMTFGFQGEKYIEVNTALNMAEEALQQDIVRCCECEKRDTKGLCYHFDIETKDNDYCKWGKRGNR